VTNQGLMNFLLLSGSNLIFLDLANVNVTCEGVSDLKIRLDNLKGLRLSNSDLTDKGLSEILSLAKNLNKLNLGFTKITGEGLVSLNGRLEKLHCLNLFDCRNLTNQGFKELLAVTGDYLIELIHFGVNVTYEGFTELGTKLAYVPRLNLKLCTSLTDRGLWELLSSTDGNLEAIILAGNHINGQGFMNLPFELKQLQELTIQDCVNITDFRLQDILGVAGKNLRKLDLDHSSISGEGVAESEIKLEKLETLTLSKCFDLTNDGLFELLNSTGGNLRALDLLATKVEGRGWHLLDAKLQNLRELNLIGCENLTNQGLFHILNISRQSLQKLDLTETLISGDQLAYWIERQQPTSLKYLYLQNCPNITPEDIERIRVFLPQCYVVPSADLVYNE